MIVLAMLFGVLLPLALTYRSPRWRAARRIIALTMLLVTLAALAAFIFGGVPVG